LGNFFPMVEGRVFCANLEGTKDLQRVKLKIFLAWRRVENGYKDEKLVMILSLNK
jgi:hypothetical protein